jgi:hypothetical protein
MEKLQQMKEEARAAKDRKIQQEKDERDSKRKEFLFDRNSSNVIQFLDK